MNSNQLIHLSICIILLVAIITSRLDGRPGKWSYTYLGQLKKLYKISGPKPYLFLQIIGVVIQCAVQFLSKKYHYKILFNPKRDLTEEEHQKLCNRCFGTLNNWNEQFSEVCVQSLEKILPRGCAYHIIKTLEENTNMYDLLKLAREKQTDLLIQQAKNALKTYLE